MKLTDQASDPSANLWLNFKAGEFSSLGMLFERHYQELFYYGNKIVALPELVKDAIQDLFVNVWERREQMLDVVNIKAYLITSLRRELIRRMLKIRKENVSESELSIQFSFSPEDFLISSEQTLEHTKLLAKSMELLTDRQREVILLRFYHNLEFFEIASVLEMNVQSVRNLLFRALEKIRRELSEQGVTGTENIEMFLWGIFAKKRF